MSQPQASRISRTERRPVTLTWRVEDAGEVASAKERFEQYVSCGWLAFTIKPGDRKIQIFEFDPELESVVLIPFAEGG